MSPMQRKTDLYTFSTFVPAKNKTSACCVMKSFACVPAAVRDELGDVFCFSAMWQNVPPSPPQCEKLFGLYASTFTKKSKKLKTKSPAEKKILSGSGMWFLGEYSWIRFRAACSVSNRRHTPAAVSEPYFQRIRFRIRSDPGIRGIFALPSRIR